MSEAAEPLQETDHNYPLYFAVQEFFQAPVWSTTSTGYLDDNEKKKAGKDVVVEKRDPETGKLTLITYNALTYGEVTIPGARDLFRHMGMAGPKTDPHEEIVFLDLGSGCGRLVMQAYMELPRVTKSRGIEVSSVRHQSAVTAWQQLKDQAKTIRSTFHPSSKSIFPGKVELIEGDFLQADISDVTHIYISSICFPDDLVYQIAEKINRETPPNLKCVATLKAFHPNFEKRGIADRITYELVYKVFGLVRRVEEVHMSWTQNRPGGCPVYVYSQLNHPTKKY